MMGWRGWGDNGLSLLEANNGFSLPGDMYQSSSPQSFRDSIPWGALMWEGRCLAFILAIVLQEQSPREVLIIEHLHGKSIYLWFSFPHQWLYIGE